jgi:histidine decarboxylase
MKSKQHSALDPEDLNTLNDFRSYIREQYRTFIGYPCRGGFDYSELYDLLEYPLNNVGDPFAPSTYRVHSREIEQQVLRWFAELTHISPDDFWGYITNGGTEGNIYGLFLAREFYPSGIVYFSESTHYSVLKNLRVLNMKHIMVKADPSGEMDYDDLRESIRIHRDSPAIIFANIGTTMTEAIDDVQHIKDILQDIVVTASYIHCDAALDGMTLPFIEGAPECDFSVGIDSLSISGHKFIGSPMPCGIVLTKKNYVDRIARSIEYIGTLDTTLSGSRNAFTPLFLWYAIRTRGVEGFSREVAQCMEKANHLINKFKKIGISAWRNPFAITVVFPKPPESILEKWQIAVQGDLAHIIMMQNITTQQIDEVVADIADAKQISDVVVKSPKTYETVHTPYQIDTTFSEIVIVVHNRPGVVADIVKALANQDINIETLEAEETDELAIVVLTVDRPNEALECLRDAGFNAVTEDTLVVRIKDKPGALASVSHLLKDEGIHLRSLRILRRQEGWAWIALATPRSEEAKALMKEYCLAL